jgi:ribosome biogenesis GTPase A
MRPRYSFSSRRTRHLKKISKQREKYPDLLKKIIKDSDIILEVLDARFPEETRNYEIEEEIKKLNEKIIYILNKSDLIMNVKENKSLNPRVLVSCKKRKGIKDLRNLIKKESKKIKKDKVLVGVIGYPNTGKSSLINLLVGKSSAGVGSDAGYTRGIQKLKLSQGIVLLDSPGVIPVKEYSNVNKEIITKHAKVGGRSYSQVKEPEIVVANLIKEYKNVFEKFYNIKTKNNPEILIEELGKRKGFLKKAGKVNEDKTARLILKDWQDGKIKV